MLCDYLKNKKYDPTCFWVFFGLAHSYALYVLCALCMTYFLSFVFFMIFIVLSSLLDILLHIS